MQRVYLIFQRLEGVVALFLGAGTGVTVSIRDLPLFRRFTVFVEALGHERGQHFINAVNGGAAIDVARHLGDDLRRDRRRGGDGFRRLNLGVTHFKTVGQHAFQVDQHAVKHREERRVVEIVIVDLTALVRRDYIARQQMLTGIVLGDDTGQQVALGRDHFAVFIGIFIEQRRVGLLYQAADLLVKATPFLTLDVTVVTILNVGARQLLVRTRHQLVFNRGLDLVDIHLAAFMHLAANDFCDGGAVICVIDSRCFSCTQNGFFDAL